MTKEPDKIKWEEAYNNKSTSGIEIRDKIGKLVNFITIKHDDVLDDKDRPHRITISLNENSELLLPPPQTFEEIIQAKRRYQMLLYGTGNSSSAAVLASRARQAAARQVVAAASRVGQRTLANIASQRKKPANKGGVSNKVAAAKSKSKRKKKPLGAPTSSSTATATAACNIQSSGGVGEKEGSEDNGAMAVVAEDSEDVDMNELKGPLHGHQVIPEQQQGQKSDEAELALASTALQPPVSEPVPSTSAKVVTSLKDLTKHKAEDFSLDTKEIKFLLKTAAPGETITLPDGTILKKSRRGGARAGAGRKRSRPIPPNSTTTTTPPSLNSTSASDGPTINQSTNSSFSSTA